jgi:CheY-like chemotaxis protein
VVLLDANMQPYNGYDMARDIRDQFGGQLTLVAVTGRRLQTDYALALMAGFNHFVTKPYDPLILLQLINRIGESRPAGPMPSA